MRDRYVLVSFQLTDGFMAVFKDLGSPDGIHIEKVVALGLAEVRCGDEVDDASGLSMVSVTLSQGEFGIAEDAGNFIGTIPVGANPFKVLNMPEDVSQKNTVLREAKRKESQERLDKRRRCAWQDAHVARMGG